MEAKVTPMGDQYLSEFENSKTDDIYFTENNMEQNSLAKNTFGTDRFSLVTATFGLAMGETAANIKHGADGTFDNSKIPFERTRGDFKNFDGITPRSGVKNHLIVFDEFFTALVFKEDYSYTIIHEVVAHAEASSAGISIEQQHDLWFGKKGGSGTDYTDASSHAEVKREIDSVRQAKKEENK